MALTRLHVKGFKSIRDQDLDLSPPLNVFIGGNGAGKSNLIGVFHLLNRIVRQELALYTGQTGGANVILHFGRKRTHQLSLEAEFATSDRHANIYQIALAPTEDDSFLFEWERTSYWDRKQYPDRPYRDEYWMGHREANIRDSTHNVARYLREHLDSFRVYQFHDTSPNAALKQNAKVQDNRFLRPDAGNLAPFLYLLREKHSDHYRNVEDAVRQIAPFFSRFVLAPTELNPEVIRLEWEERGGDTIFGPAALSDGSLRFICLATLLLQPTPSIIVIDEPELGLHPSAIHLLAGMLQSAATRTQILVATQSVTLINQLNPEHVWIVDREDGETKFRHLAAADMSAWLEDYSLGELWEKNVLGGRP